MATPTKQVSTKTTYLDMHAPQPQDVPAPLPEIEVEAISTPSVPFYRELFDAVGSDYHWASRKLMSDAELEMILHHERTDLYLLKVAGERAGFSELDRREPDQVEITFFGLLAPFIGKGLGKYFLQWTLDRAWSHQPDRVWLHTCTLDHTAALPNYLRAGMQIYDEKVLRHAIFD